MPQQEWIKSYLKSNGHKLKDVAEALNISPPRVTDILMGRREVQSNEVTRLASFLNLSVASLLASLREGELTEAHDPNAAPTLPILGTIYGHGRVEPLAQTVDLRTVSMPVDAAKSDGLFCFVMGDDVLNREIKKGSLIIAGDPRQHHYPLTPGSLFLIGPNKKQLAPRQYYQTPVGENWLVPLTNEADTSFKSWRFRQEENDDKRPSGPISSFEKNGACISDVFAVIMWVQQRYAPPHQQ